MKKFFVLFISIFCFGINNLYADYLTIIGNYKTMAEARSNIPKGITNMKVITIKNEEGYFCAFGPFEKTPDVSFTRNRYPHAYVKTVNRNDVTVVYVDKETEQWARNASQAFKEMREEIREEKRIEREMAQNTTQQQPRQQTQPSQPPQQQIQTQQPQQPQQPEVKNYFNGNNDISVFLQDSYDGKRNSIRCLNFTGEKIVLYVSYTQAWIDSNNNIYSRENISHRECTIDKSKSDQLLVSAYMRERRNIGNSKEKIINFKVEKYIIYYD